MAQVPPRHFILPPRDGEYMKLEDHARQALAIWTREVRDMRPVRFDARMFCASNMKLFAANSLPAKQGLR